MEVLDANCKKVLIWSLMNVLLSHLTLYCITPRTPVVALAVVDGGAEVVVLGAATRGT